MPCIRCSRMAFWIGLEGLPLSFFETVRGKRKVRKKTSIALLENLPKINLPKNKLAWK